MKDQQLIASLKAGNHNSFEKMYETYYSPLVDFARLHINDHENARDIVQRTFMHLWENRMELVIESNLQGYLFTSVKNRCINHHRHLKVKMEHRKNASHHLHLVHSDDLVSQEVETRVQQAIEALPEQCRAVFKLSRFDQLKYHEIAEKLGLSIKTVEAHMGKALRQLRHDLAEYLPLLILIYPTLFSLIH